MAQVQVLANKEEDFGDFSPSTKVDFDDFTNISFQVTADFRVDNKQKTTLEEFDDFQSPTINEEASKINSDVKFQLKEGHSLKSEKSDQELHQRGDSFDFGNDSNGVHATIDNSEFSNFTEPSTQNSFSTSEIKEDISAKELLNVQEQKKNVEASVIKEENSDGDFADFNQTIPSFQDFKIPTILNSVSEPIISQEENLFDDIPSFQIPSTFEIPTSDSSSSSMKSSSLSEGFTIPATSESSNLFSVEGTLNDSKEHEFTLQEKQEDISIKTLRESDLVNASPAVGPEKDLEPDDFGDFNPPSVVVGEDSKAMELNTTSVVVEEDLKTNDFGDFNTSVPEKKLESDDFGNFDTPSGVVDGSSKANDFGDFSASVVTEKKLESDNFGNFQTSVVPAKEASTSKGQSTAAFETTSGTVEKPELSFDADFGDFETSANTTNTTPNGDDFADFETPSATGTNSTNDDFGDFGDFETSPSSTTQTTKVDFDEFDFDNPETTEFEFETPTPTPPPPVQQYAVKKVPISILFSLHVAFF